MMVLARKKLKKCSLLFLGAPRLGFDLRAPFRPFPGEAGSPNLLGAVLKKCSGPVRVYGREPRDSNFLGKSRC